MRLALLLFLANAHADVAIRSPSSEGELRFDLISRPLPGNPGFTQLQPTTLRWQLRDGRVVWKRPLPEHLQLVTALEKSYAERPDLAEGQVQSIFQRLIRPDALVLATHGQVLILDRADGHTLFEWKDSGDRQQLFFDQGTLTISDSKRLCTEKVVGRFLVECAGRVYLFDGHTFAAFAVAPYRFLESGSFLVENPIRGRSHFLAHAKIAAASLSLDAMIFD